MLCQACQKRTKAYNAARYAKAPKPWPVKRLCRKCRAGLRETRKMWRRDWVSKNRAQTVEAQRRYRARLKKAI